MPEKDNTELGLGQNVEGALCYLLGFITGILFLLLEKKNSFVRFHAVQSTITFLGLWVLNAILTIVFAPLSIGGFVVVSSLSTLVGIVGFVLWIVLMFKAYEGEKYKLPVIGDHAEHYAKELNI